MFLDLIMRDVAVIFTCAGMECVCISNRCIVETCVYVFEFVRKLFLIKLLMFFFDFQKKRKRISIEYISFAFALAWRLWRFCCLV